MQHPGVAQPFLIPGQHGLAGSARLQLAAHAAQLPRNSPGDHSVREVGDGIDRHVGRRVGVQVTAAVDVARGQEDGRREYGAQPAQPDTERQ